MIFTDNIDGRKMALYASDVPGSHPLIVLHGDPETDSGIMKAAATLPENGTAGPFHLLVLETLNWNDEMTPFPHEPFFKRGEAYGGQADRYLEILEERLLPRAEALLPEPVSYRVLAGYSLAGLFAVYALFRTDLFRRAACVSGSLWYPGFAEYTFSHELPGSVDRVYFSLGDRESSGRNPVFSKADEKMRLVEARFRELGAETVFESNPGNHFNDPEGRVLKGLAWILRP